MDIMKEKIGIVVNNDGQSLKETLGLDKMQHKGDYVFEGYKGGIIVIIKTKPQDIAGERIEIIDIQIDPDAIQHIGIVYHMIRGNETAETYVELPILGCVFFELEEYIDKEKNSAECHTAIKEILKKLVALQGYKELGTYTIDAKLF